MCGRRGPIVPSKTAPLRTRRKVPPIVACRATRYTAKFNVPVAVYADEPIVVDGATYGDREPLPVPSLRRAPAPGRVDRTVFMRPRRVNVKYLSSVAPSPADLQPPPSRRHRAGDPVRVNEAEPRLNCRYPGSRRVVWAHVGGGAALRGSRPPPLKAVHPGFQISRELRIFLARGTFRISFHPESIIIN